MTKKKEPQRFVTFTPATVAEFEKVCEAAARDGKTEFSWDGNVFLVSYARYLIEYLKRKLAVDA